MDAKSDSIIISNPITINSFKKNKKNLLFAIILVSLGILIGIFSSFAIIDKNTLILSHVNRNHLHVSEFYKSKFYKTTPQAKGANPFDVETTIRRIYESFPRVDTEKGSDNIFQMWKKKPWECEEGEFPNLDTVQLWQNINTYNNYTFYTNKEIDQIIKRVFKPTVPEIWEAYRLLPKIILQSDFGRYLLVFLEGGTYSDIDVHPHVPVNEWYDSYISSDIGVVISVEADPNGENWQHSMPRRLQFLQWTFKTKRRHPAFARLIANIVKVTFQAQVENSLTAFFSEFSDDSLDRCRSVDVMDWTGPGVFTDSMYEYFNTIQDLEIVDFDLYRDNQGEPIFGPEVTKNERVNWKLLTGLEHPIVIGDVLILPQRGFKANGSCSDLCYTSHRFSGSWKKGNV